MLIDSALSMFRACVAQDPHGLAISYLDGDLTYQVLDDQSDALARWLLDNGVGAGSRVAAVLQTVPQFVLVTLAAWKIGGVIVPCNPMYKEAELARILADAEPSAVLCFEGQVEEIRAALTVAGLHRCHILTTSPYSFQTAGDPRVLPPRIFNPRSDIETLEQILKIYRGLRPPAIELEGNALALLLYTSGTTGLPKGAMIRHRNLCFNATQFAGLSQVGDTSRILCLSPLFHITGFVLHLVMAFAARATMIMHFRFEPTVVRDIIRARRPTFTIAAITAFNALINTPGIIPDDMASFDTIYSGGAPISPALLRQIEERLQIKVHNAYGLTETSAPTHLAPRGVEIPVDPSSGALSIGKLMPQTVAKIVDADGVELPSGQPGELLIKGPQLMAGYWRKGDAEQPFVDGWLRTGDVAFVDGNGWFYIVDRLKDMIIASGFKVWPREVEDVLYGHFAVREAAVVGVTDSYRGEAVKAFVSLKEGQVADAVELIIYCRSRLAAYKVPREIEIVPELPKTVSGKIQRAALRAE